LKAKELVFSGAQNEPSFHGQKPQSKLRIRPKNDNLLGIEQNKELENRNSKTETGKSRCHSLLSAFCFIGRDQELEAGKVGCQFPFSSF